MKFRGLILALLITASHPVKNFAEVGFNYPTDFKDVPKSERSLMRDLILQDFPPTDWRQESPSSLPAALSGEKTVYDVAIIGAGMAGLTCGAALYKEGIFNIMLFDENPKGYEGPWITHARMQTLRTDKEIMGCALDIPHLTFRAWFEAEFGQSKWDEMEKIPNHLWMEYLNWYKQVMQIPVENECQCLSITPTVKGWALTFKKKNEVQTTIARKVVLATGRVGFGGRNIPKFAHSLPKSNYAHTAETIDPAFLKNKNIAVIGAGASAFDAAGVALESGAHKVDLIMRRKELPQVQKFAALPKEGFLNGFTRLDDITKWNFMYLGLSGGTPPPQSALDRVKNYSNFTLRSSTSIKSAICKEGVIFLQTEQESLSYDFLILGTGYLIDGHLQKELSSLICDILLWKDKLPQETVLASPEMGEFPYLGPSFEFLPKTENGAKIIKNIHCFNYAAILSHGLVCNDMQGISKGATKLAQAIAGDFFIEDAAWYLEQMEKFEGSTSSAPSK